MKALMLATLLASAAQATTYPVPDPAIFINPNYGNTTTIVTMAGVTYRGPSAFVYAGECARPDDAGYRCDILTEYSVQLTAPGHAPIGVSLTIQSANVLIRSGHNYWRHSDTLLSGSVTL